MVRYGSLFSKITNIDNLHLAYTKARKNKGKRKEVLDFELQCISFLTKLQQQLTIKSYRTSKYHTFTIYEPKERIIYKLPFYPDRIVHHAIMNILEPIWVSTFIKNTYSCVKGRGIHAAVKDIKKDLKDINGTKYCLKLDIKKFYPSIDHDILKIIIRKKIKDKELLWLLDEIIDSTDGVPIGNYLSQFFANLYLTYFDHWLKETKKVKYYYRYADDIVILHSDKNYLYLLFKEVKEELSKLKLEVKSNYQIFPLDSRGLSFVGYVFYHNKIKIRKGIKLNMRKTSKRYSYSFAKYKAHMCSYLGWLKYCNGKHLSKKNIKYKELLQYAYL